MNVSTVNPQSAQFAVDAVSAMAKRSGCENVTLSPEAQKLASRPLWVIAHQSLQLAGIAADLYGDRQSLVEMAMQMGESTRRSVFYSENENPVYTGAMSSAGPAASPGDFPNILSGLANKFLDSVELDDEFSFPAISAVLPGGLNDFKPAMMINRSAVEEMDELSDAEKFRDIGLTEEVLSYIVLRRFGNRFGWTPVMIANDDLGAFAEGMLGLAEAWQVTQNRLVLDRFTGSETLLDGSALFANRADTGSGAIPAANNNLRSTGGAPSDTEWGAMWPCQTGRVAAVEKVTRYLSLPTMQTDANTLHSSRLIPSTFEGFSHGPT